MNDVDRTLEAQREQIARLHEENAGLRGALHEARRGLRPENQATFMLPDGQQVAYADFVELDAVFTMSIYKAGEYILHDKAPEELGVEKAGQFGLILGKPRRDRGPGSSIGWLIHRVQCLTEGVVVSLGRASTETPLQVLAGRRLIEGKDFVIPITVPWGLSFQIHVEVPCPVDLRVIISGLRRT